MITLIIRPNFNFKLGYKESGDYIIYLPQNKIPICKMWCSSLNWLSTDIGYNKFLEPLSELLEGNELSFIFDKRSKEDLDEVNRKNAQIDINNYYKNRGKYCIPPWESKDIYQYLTFDD